MARPLLTVLNQYSLVGNSADFTAAIKTLAARVASEGHPGVLSYRFYVCEEEGTARAVIDYADSSAWIGHHDIAMGWPEMKALHTVASLNEVTFLGPFTPDIRAWLDGSRLKVRINSGYAFAAGFQRD